MTHVGHLFVEQSDTSPRAMQRYLKRLRETPPREKLERALRLSEKVRDATMAEIRRQMPDADERALARELVRRVYGERLAARLDRPGRGT
jgi:hypothetical protein